MRKFHVLLFSLIISLGAVCWADPLQLNPNFKPQPKSGTPKLNPHVILQPQKPKGSPLKGGNIPLIDPSPKSPMTFPFYPNSQGDPLTNIYQYGYYRKSCYLLSEKCYMEYSWSNYDPTQGESVIRTANTLYDLVNKGGGFPTTGGPGLTPPSKWEWGLINHLKSSAQDAKNNGQPNLAELELEDKMFFDILSFRAGWQLIDCNFNQTEEKPEAKVNNCIFRRQLRASEVQQ